MKRSHLLGFVAALGAAPIALALFGSPEAGAQKKPAPAAKDAGPPPIPPPPVATADWPQAPEDPPMLLAPEALSDFMDKLLDKVYVDRYKKVQPGPAMKALDAELADTKGAFRRSLVEFGVLPTGIDQTPLLGEYSYNNSEALMTAPKIGNKRFFFFIGKKLWKIYDEIPLKENGELGASYQDAVNKAQTKLGVAGRVLVADPAQGRRYTEVDWRAKNRHVRLLDRSPEHLVAVVQMDPGTFDAIATLRRNKMADVTAVDPTVAAALRGGGGDGGVVVGDPNAGVADAFTGKSHTAPPGPATGKPAQPPPKPKK